MFLLESLTYIKHSIELDKQEKANTQGKSPAKILKKKNERNSHEEKKYVEYSSYLI